MEWRSQQAAPVVAWAQLPGAIRPGMPVQSEVLGNPLRQGVPPHTRSGQSAEVMSQNPHSRGLGTRRAGARALSRCTNSARFPMNASPTAAGPV